MVCQQHRFPLDDFDALRVHRQLCPDGPGFLESPAPNPRLGRYSIVPLRRRESYRLDGQGLACLTANGETLLPGDPFTALERILAQRHCRPRLRDCPFPGGFFGFFSYDLAGRIEDLPRRARRDRPVPDLWLDWVDLTAVYDHQQRLVTLSSLDTGDDLLVWEQEIRDALRCPLPEEPGSSPPPTAMVAPEQFRAMIERAQDYIAAGHIYQANLSVRFDTATTLSSTELYRRLRHINPSPFGGLLRSPGLDIISASPERLFSLRGRTAETRPIAGTRPRGYHPAEDRALGEELLGHPKERAEHIMLLDLERNDLGKVCRTGSVEVDEFMVLERYSHVTHIVSNVRGELRDGIGPFALLRAMFPGGTITGVPKKRCMEIIDELEPVGRGTYTGSAGYLSVTGEVDLNILIRTFQRFADGLTYQTGAGIVADSVPEREWQECLAKGQALRQALERP